MTTLYFTGTGNSLYVAKQIGGQLLSIPQLIKDNTLSITDDVVGIVYPCYGFNVPDYVADYLRKAQIQAEYIFAVMTYAGDAFGGVRHMEKILAGVSIPLDYGNEIIMPNNYLIGNDLSEQVTEAESARINAELSAIARDIHERKKQTLHKGILSEATSAAMRGLMKAMGMTKNADKSFTVNDACNTCGTCTKVCPLKNITVSDAGRVEFHHHCTFCTACINYCPQNAIHHKREKSDARYQNPSIDISEMIASNNQYEDGEK